MGLIAVDGALVSAIVTTTTESMSMASIVPVPVGIGIRLSTARAVTAIIGFAGSNCGSILLNVSEEGACNLAGKMLGQTYDAMSGEVADGVCEMANIIAGQLRSALDKTPQQIERISVPAVVLGSSYRVAPFKGMLTASVEFAVEGACPISKQDLGFAVGLCSLKV
ncbi:MAG: chemotaxis protein CheX [Planctomycetota bacterium]